MFRRRLPVDDSGSRPTPWLEAQIVGPLLSLGRSEVENPGCNEKAYHDDKRICVK